MHMNKFLKFFKKRVIALDLLQGYVRILDPNEEEIICTSIEDFIKDKNISEALAEKFKNEDYIYDDEAMDILFKHVISGRTKGLGNIFLIVSIPHEMLANINEAKPINILKGIFKKYIIKGVFFTSNILVAASGEEEKIFALNDEAVFEKSRFIYSYKNHTYICIVFGGGCFFVKRVEKNFSNIDSLDLEKMIKDLELEISKELPKEYDISLIKKEDRQIVKKSWDLPLTNKVYIVSENCNIEALRHSLPEYKFIECTDYNKVILDGLIEGIKKL